MSRKNCPNCDKPQASDAKFCSDCGSPMSVKKAADRKPTASKKSSSRDLIIIVTAIVVVAGAFLIYKYQQSSPQEAMVDNPHQGVEGTGGMGAIPGMPTDYESLVAMGHQTMDQGNYAMAAESYRRALALNGESPDLRTDYGACLHGMGLPQRALEEFHKVIKEHPEHGIANFNIGVTYYTMGQVDSARVYWNQYLAIEPDGSASAQAKQYLMDTEG